MAELNSQPNVSVIIATYNEPEAVIRESIQSILNQTIFNLEVLILDDSTSIVTRQALETFLTDKRVRIIRGTKRIGFVQSLNMGLEQAKGRFIARMDGDDIALPDRLAKQVAYLDAHPNISILGGSMNIIDENSKLVSTRMYPTNRFSFNWLSVFRNPLAHPTVMFRRSVVDAGFYYDDSFKKSEDLEFWLRLRKNGYILANMPDILLNYRVCGDQSIKRENNNWKYNLMARKKNFSWKLPIINSLSIIVSYMYNIMPCFVMRTIYGIENNRKRVRDDSKERSG